eukprot:3458586-Rhodomonas_salina.3
MNDIHSETCLAGTITEQCWRPFSQSILYPQLEHNISLCASEHDVSVPPSPPICASDCLQQRDCIPQSTVPTISSELLSPCANPLLYSQDDKKGCRGFSLAPVAFFYITTPQKPLLMHPMWSRSVILEHLLPLLANTLEWDLLNVRLLDNTLESRRNNSITLAFMHTNKSHAFWDQDKLFFYNNKTKNDISAVLRAYAGTVDTELQNTGLVFNTVITITATQESVHIDDGSSATSSPLMWALIVLVPIAVLCVAAFRPKKK